jgi:hypothetical protein
LVKCYNSIISMRLRIVIFSIVHLIYTNRVYFICVLADNLSFIYLLSKCYDYKYNHISSIMLGMTT